MNIELLTSGTAALLISALITSMLVPLIHKLALSARAVDYPGGRRIHGRVVPRLGGLAILVGLGFGVSGIVLIGWPVHGRDIVRSQLIAWALGVGMVFMVGLLEDLIGVSAGKRFLVEIAAAWIIVTAGWQFSFIGLPCFGNLQLGWLGPLVTIVWIVGVTNAINLIDGLDGLAGGIVAIIAASLALMAAIRGNFFTIILMAGVIGACLGFLRYNWEGKIFMGDAGSLTLGFILATITVHGSMKSSAAVAILIPILAMGVPVIDTLLVMIVRFIDSPRDGRHGRLGRIFHADQNHLHHLVIYLARHRKTAVGWVYALVAFSCAASLIVVLSKSGIIGYVLLGVQIITIVIIRKIGFARRAKAMSLKRREEMRSMLGISIEGE